MKVEVIVVDNASVDGSVAMVKREFPWMNIIANKQNVGFARANNQGIKFSSGKYILLINPDTIVQENTLTVLYKYMEKHVEVGITGCKILNADGSLQLACRRSFPTPLVALPKLLGLSYLFPKNPWFGRYNLTYKNPDEMTEVDAVSGSFMFIRKLILDQIGMLDESFFMYGEDLDLCYRARKAGWKIMYVPDTKIIHYKGESSKLAPFDSHIAFYRAMDRFVSKHFSRGYYIAFSMFIRLGIVFHGAFGLLGKIIYSLRALFMDFLSIYIAILLGWLIRFGDMFFLILYQPVIAMYASVYLIVGFFMGLYSKHRYNILSATLSVFLGMLVNGTLTFLLPQFAYSRLVFAYSFFFILFFIPGWRIVLPKILPRKPRRAGGKIIPRKVVVVGAGTEGQRIANKLSQRVQQDFDFIGFIDSNSGDTPEVIGSIMELAEIIRIHQIDEVIFTMDRFTNTEILNAIEGIKAQTASLKIVPSSLEYILGKASVETIDDIPLIDLDYSVFTPWNRALKRLFDCILGILLLFFTGLFVYPVKRLVGGRLFSMEIAGSEGKKIRLKYLCRPDGTKGPFFWIPFLVDIIKGNISFVGSPIIPGGKDNWKPLVKPGITGILQLHGTKDWSVKELERYDHFYARNQSIVLDIEILLKTLFGM
jgi:GT2 family glycosyltransferase/lipopolysaccharide/colanic/teichoic acid biosynthesis glycosyltransferase